ncbi:MAG: HlyD family efflux transporter periplasmic adaptor subunit [Gammaproteobacteria bacterium]|nr:HlyD family efflux transporter periplasmic adaptor subunit [Gammaproteobacteria bacterium]
MRVRNIRQFILPPLIIAGGALVFWYLSSSAPPPEPLRAETRAPVVSVRAAEKVTAAPTLRVFGRVESPTRSVLTAGVEADVVEVAALEGDAVRRGQALVVLDGADADLQLRQRRAELADIDAQLDSETVRQRADIDALKTEEALLALRARAVDRAAQLARSRSGSEAALDQAREQHERQRLAVLQRRQSIDDAPARRRQLQARRARAAAAAQQAERDLARTRVTAPFNGRVTQVFVAAGERVSAGGRLLELYDEAQLELRAQVPSGHLPALRRALAAGRTVTAVVAPAAEAVDTNAAAAPALVLHRLSAQVGSGRGGVDAFFRAGDGAGDGDGDGDGVGDGAGGLPVPGATMEIHLRLPPLDNVVLLSPDSLYGNARIYLVRDDKLQAKTVRRLGRIDAGAGDGAGAGNNDGDGDGDGRGEMLLIVAGDDFQAGDLILDSRLPQAINGLQVRIAP